MRKSALLTVPATIGQVFAARCSVDGDEADGDRRGERVLVVCMLDEWTDTIVAVTEKPGTPEALEDNVVEARGRVLAPESRQMNRLTP